MSSAVSRLESVNAMAELERAGWPFEPISEDEVRCKCPVHEDNTPSLCLNTKKNVWICQASSCKKSGDIATLLALILQVERSTILVDLSTRYDIEDLKVINPQVVERAHAEIWSAGPLLTALRERGVTDDMIRRARIGFDRTKGRLTIPVYDIQGNVVNIRRYLPGAPGHLKMQNMKGYGSLRIYQMDQVVKYNRLWFMGGELKALVAAALLNIHGVGCFSVTAGEGAWETKWNSLLKGKHVFVCMDVDLAGRTAARKLGSALYRAAESVHIIHLPLDKTKYPKGDINDYVGQEHAKDTDLLRLMDESVEFRPNAGSTNVPTEEQEIVQTTLSGATKPSNIGKRISFEAVVTAMDTNPFLIPKSVRVACDRAQPNCGICPISTIEPSEDTGGVRLTIPSSASGLLEIINAPSSRVEDGIRNSLDIPRCRSAQFAVLEHYEVRDARLSPQLSIGSQSSDNVVQPGLLFIPTTELNTPYMMAGVVYPHPKNQQAVLMVDEAEEVDDNLSSFSPSAAELDELQVFRPKEWTAQSIREKINEIYGDLEQHVTRIYGRRDLHLVVDLTYHSPLTISFDSKVAPGWVNSLILGDSSQGKSETTLQLQKHYGLGERVELKNATTAGLIGGLQQLGTRWFVSWGVIPTHDRRLVILEEVKGASTEMLGRLTDMRSSGVAEIPKIERRRSHARTRLIFVSNPRSSRPMSAFGFGIEAISELIGSQEDVRRFDIALIVSASDVDPSVVNARLSKKTTSTPKFTSLLCRRNVLFAWTRSVDQVAFDEDASALIASESIELCKRFTESLPLVDRGTIRFKLARLAAALAARTNSVTDEDNEVLRVRRCHVDFIVHFLTGIYSRATFGYADYSRALAQANSVLDVNLVEMRLLGSKHPKDFIRQILYRDQITLEDIQDWSETDQDTARATVSFFVRKHCLYREQRAYVKTPSFIDLLKALEVKAKEGPEVEEGAQF